MISHVLQQNVSLPFNFQEWLSRKIAKQILTQFYIYDAIPYTRTTVLILKWPHLLKQVLNMYFTSTH